MLILKINFKNLKIYYFNIFSSKKYFEKQHVSYSQTFCVFILCLKSIFEYF
jgi:hypothetical protein